VFRIKICGLRSPSDVETCVAAGVDAVGFIFAESPARVAPDEAAFIARSVPPWVTRVGVFADTPADVVAEVQRACRFDLLQFCGHEDFAYCGSFDVPTVLSLGIAQDENAWPIVPNAEDLRVARAVALAVDSRIGGRTGGTGRPVPWRVAAHVRARSAVPIVLAGGLDPDNVVCAVRAVRPAAVDVRTGVTRNGRLDPGLVRTFVHRVRPLLMIGGAYGT
jgi:phosphoribosylanthranilate isomerase